MSDTKDNKTKYINNGIFERWDELSCTTRPSFVLIMNYLLQRKTNYRDFKCQLFQSPTNLSKRPLYVYYSCRQVRNMF